MEKARIAKTLLKNMMEDMSFQIIKTILMPYSVIKKYWYKDRQTLVYTGTQKR